MKKKFLFYAFLPLMAFAIFFACQKNDDSSLATKTSKNNPAHGQNGNEAVTSRSDFDFSDCSYQLGLVTKSSGRLVFQDQEHFENCALCLEHYYDDHNDAFDSTYSSATSEQLDSIAEVIGFNEWYPYEQFESSLSFSSLRAKIKAESETFLDSVSADSIDLDLDPDGLCPVIRSSDRALLNEDGEVMVDDTLRTVENDWTDRSIPDACGNLLLRGKTFTEADNAVLINRKLKVWIWVQSGLVYSKLVGKMKYYKKNGNGHYRSNVRADMRVHVQGKCFSGDCESTSQNWNNTDGWKKRTHLQVTSTAGPLRWREAFVDDSDEQWHTDASYMTAELFSNQNYFSFPLAR